MLCPDGLYSPLEFSIKICSVLSNLISPYQAPTCNGDQSHQEFLILISLWSLACYAIQNVSLNNHARHALLLGIGKMRPKVVPLTNDFIAPT